MESERIKVYVEVNVTHRLDEVRASRSIRSV